jgi:extracellular elastinolytic metalloproteinase
MRPAARALLLVAALVAAASVHAHAPGTRKSLSFGPVLPHATFNSAPHAVSVTAFKRCAPETDPLEVARLFVEHHLHDQLSAAHGYTIRDDSYTDVRTGVTHVYVRQLVNGIEVQDGDLSINIKNGEVLSYGDSVSHFSYRRVLSTLSETEGALLACAGCRP